MSAMRVCVAGWVDKNSGGRDLPSCLPFFDDGQILAAFLNIGLEVILGLAAVWLGGTLSRLL